MNKSGWYLLVFPNIILNVSHFVFGILKFCAGVKCQCNFSKNKKYKLSKNPRYF